MLSLSIAILVLGVFGATILHRHLREAKLLRLREIRHKERMMAMEHNLAAPDTDTARVDSLLGENEGADSSRERMSGTAVHWVRLAALALGLTCLFGGVGAIPGLYFLSDPELRGTWPLGLVPIFAGVGLLLFIRLSRDLADKINSGEKPQ